MASRERQLSSFLNHEMKEYAKSVLYDRAIPCVIDGLKPSQRKALYAALKHCANQRIKTASLSGNMVSTSNYHHGTASADGTIIGMAQDWNNNICLLIGEGAFGSRLLQEAAAPRYTYVKLNPQFYQFFKDLDLCPHHEDPEEPEPKYYLPVIPWILVNGCRGIATGFATEIQPRNPKDIIKACKNILNGKGVKEEDLPPYFEGTKIEVYREDGEWWCRGQIEQTGSTKYRITEVPIGYDREGYVKVLYALQDSGKIVSFVDECSKEGFNFSVTVKRGSKISDPYTFFKLKKKLNENITTIDEHGNLLQFDSAVDIVHYFVSFKTQILEIRRNKKLADLALRLMIVKSIIKFLSEVVDGRFEFKRGESRASLKKRIADLVDCPDVVEKILSMPITSFTKEVLEKYKKEEDDLWTEREYWRSTTAEAEFQRDLKEIKL